MPVKRRWGRRQQRGDQPPVSESGPGAAVTGGGAYSAPSSGLRPFAPHVQGTKVVVIGSYPGLEASGLLGDFTCLERRPRPGELPDTAAESILPQAEWVFITASSIANKTLPRLLTLSARARVVLMGPSVALAV